jgi:hypothetical protein
LQLQVRNTLNRCNETIALTNGIICFTRPQRY